MSTYKLRLFFNAIVSPNIATGQILIRKGSKDYILKLLKENLKKCKKVIIEAM